MNTQQRMEYILNHEKIIQHYMKLHDEEVKTRQTAWQKFKGALKWHKK
jgi:hypothetical protein